MTQAEAQAEAVRRWPEEECYTGWVRKVGKSVHEVGELIGGCEICGPPDFYVRGKGDSWESAFADADRREGGKTE